MMDKLLALRASVLAGLHKVSGLAPLLARLAVAVVFISTGWGKLHSLEKVTAFFTDLGIPAPGAQAVMVSMVEFGGGLLLLVGLASRLAALPMAATMVVAILTAKRSEIEGVSDVFGFVEFSYLMFFCIIVLAGPGPFSLDALLAKRLDARAGPAVHASPT